MPDFDEQQIVAAAIRMMEEAGRFRDPVRFYVAGEAGRRWSEANPDKCMFTDVTPGFDWELESWKILARAALGAEVKR